MPQTEGAGIVYTGGPGTSMRAPLFVKTPALPGQNSNLFAFTQFMDTKGEWALQIHTVTLTSAQILALATPLDLSTLYAGFGAPGAGNIIIPDFIIAELIFNTIAYTGASTLSVTYGSGGPAVHPTAISAALVTAAQTEVFYTAGGMSAQQATNVLNTGLFIGASASNFAAGNSTMMLKIGYRILQGF